MKTLKTLRSALLCASLVLFFACSEKGDKTHDGDNHGASTSNMNDAAVETDAAVDDAAADWRTERDEYRAEANRRIERNDEELERMRVELKSKKAEARRDYEEEIAELDSRNERMKARIAENKDDSREGWNNFKREFDHDMEDLGNSISNVFKDNKPNTGKDHDHDHK
jgi:hypothetical protein